MYLWHLKPYQNPKQGICFYLLKIPDIAKMQFFLLLW